MKQYAGLLVCMGVLALGASSASAHTRKVCWRAESDGSVTMFAGTYHDEPGLFGGVVVDGTRHDFTGSISALPADVTACQADCQSTQPIAKWQTVRITVPAGLHTVTTTATSGIEDPLPGCYPTSFGLNDAIATSLAYSGATSGSAAVPVTVGAIIRPGIVGVPVVLTLAGVETCTALTDDSGIASCAITPQRPAGVYPLTASYAGDGAILPSAVTVPFTVTQAPTKLVYTGATSGDHHDPAIVAARLFPEFPGAKIVFTLAGTDTCTGATDAGGNASCALTPTVPAGVYPLVATFEGDGKHLPASVSVAFTVNREQTTLVYVGDTHVATAEPARLAAVLREDGVVPLPGRTVQLTLGTGAAAQSCSGITDAAGLAACVVAAVDQPLGDPARVAIAASFAGDAWYQPSAASATARLQYMTGAAHAISGSLHVLLGAITIPRTPYTGAVRTAHASTTTVPCVPALLEKLLGLEIVSAKHLCANVTTDVAPGSAAATASIEQITVALGGLLPVIRLTGLTAYAEAGCDGASGAGSVATLSIGGVSIPVSPAPNTTIALPLGGRITLNEQVPAADADHGLTVRAAHIVVPPALGLAGVDLVLASATSGIHQCRPVSASPTALDDSGDAGGAAGEDGEDGAAGEAAGADAASAGGCQATRPAGAAWLAVLALGLAVGAGRRRRRG